MRKAGMALVLLWCVEMGAGLSQMKAGAEVTDLSYQAVPSLLSWQAVPETVPSSQLATDRPDFTESPSTVGPGVIQLETGVTVRFVRLAPAGHLHRQDWGETLLRIGLPAPWLEARLALPAGSVVLHSGTGMQRIQGWEDAVVGAKFALAGQQGPRPQLAAIVQATLPTGRRAFRAGAVQPGTIVIAGWELSPQWSTAGAIQWHFLRGEDDRLLLQTGLSWTVSRNLGRNWAGYAEWFSLLHSGAGVGNQHYFNTGLTWLIGPDCQWDIRFGTGLHGEEWFAGSGFSFRWR